LEDFRYPKPDTPPVKTAAPGALPLALVSALILIETYDWTSRVQSHTNHDSVTARELQIVDAMMQEVYSKVA
jgi:hypothetical protein